MDPARIAALLAPFLPCHPEERSAEGPAVTGDRRLATGDFLHQLSTYLDLLLRWNARINLTAVRDPGDIVTRHFGESLFAAAHLFPAAGPTGGPEGSTDSAATGPSANYKLQITNYKLLDLGSGAGFPGLPIKIWAPQLAVTLIESRQRKATFLREVVRTLALTGVAVFSGRAQDFPGPPADVVTLRAVERFHQVLPLAARLLAPGGRLALLIGAAQVPRAHALLPHLAWSDPLPIPLSSARVLLIGTYPERHDSNL